MKRVLKIVAVVLVVLVAGAAALVGSAFIGRQAITDGAEVNGVRIIKDGIVSVGIVPVGPGQVALVDGGNDASGKATQAELSRRQLGNNSVVAPGHTQGSAAYLVKSVLFMGDAADASSSGAVIGSP